MRGRSINLSFQFNLVNRFNNYFFFILVDLSRDVLINFVRPMNSYITSLRNMSTHLLKSCSLFIMRDRYCLEFNMISCLFNIEKKLRRAGDICLQIPTFVSIFSRKVHSHLSSLSFSSKPRRMINFEISRSRQCEIAQFICGIQKIFYFQEHDFFYNALDTVQGIRYNAHRRNNVRERYLSSNPQAFVNIFIIFQKYLLHCSIFVYFKRSRV